MGSHSYLFNLFFIAEWIICNVVCVCVYIYVFIFSLSENIYSFSDSVIPVQFSHSVMSDFLIPMNHSTPGLPVHHQLPDFTQTHVHWVGDAIQPSHPLSSPSPSALNLSQHQGLFQWVSSSHLVAKVLEFQLQHQSFQWTPRTDLLQNGLVGSPCSPRDSQESSPTPQFKSIHSSGLSFSPTLTSNIFFFRFFSVYRLLQDIEYSPCAI